MEHILSVIELIEKYKFIFLIYLAAVNFAAFLLYGIDKAKARRGAWRISEAKLITVALLGGSLGALLGMQIFRHKTEHTKFVLAIPLLLLLHTLIIAAAVILSQYTGHII